MMVTVLFHLSHGFDFSEGQNQIAALGIVHPYREGGDSRGPSEVENLTEFDGQFTQNAGACDTIKASLPGSKLKNRCRRPPIFLPHREARHARPAQPIIPPPPPFSHPTTGLHRHPSLCPIITAMLWVVAAMHQLHLRRPSRTLVAVMPGPASFLSDGARLVSLKSTRASSRPPIRRRLQGAPEQPPQQGRQQSQHQQPPFRGQRWPSEPRSCSLSTPPDRRRQGWASSPPRPLMPSCSLPLRLPTSGVTRTPHFASTVVL